MDVELVLSLTDAVHRALVDAGAVLGEDGDSLARRLRWEDVAEGTPEMAAFMPCGYGLDEAVAEGQELLDVPALATAARIYAANANAYFSCPAPRVVDGMEALARRSIPALCRHLGPATGIVSALTCRRW